MDDKHGDHFTELDEPEEAVDDPAPEVEIDDPAPEVEVDDSTHAPDENEVVLVKMKKLTWPAIIQKRENDMVEVKMIFDDKIKVVPKSDIEDFDISKIVKSAAFL